MATTPPPPSDGRAEKDAKIEAIMEEIRDRRHAITRLEQEIDGLYAELGEIAQEKLAYSGPRRVSGSISDRIERYLAGLDPADSKSPAEIAAAIGHRDKQVVWRALSRMEKDSQVRKVAHGQWTRVR